MTRLTQTIQMQRYASGLLIIGLFFTVTNRIYLSAVPAVTILLIVPLLIIWISITALRRDPHSSNSALFERDIAYVFSFAVLFYAAAIVSTLFYQPSSLLEFSFYRYDGNFIISFAAFLLLPFYADRFNLQHVLTWFLIFVGLLNAILLCSHFYNIFNIGRTPNAYDVFFSLFRSTSAASGFLAITLSLAFAKFWFKREKTVLIIIFVLLVALLLTGSRGSLLALIAGSAFAFFTHHKFLKWGLSVLFGLIIITQLTLIHQRSDIYQSGLSGWQYHALTNQPSAEFNYVKKRNVTRRLISFWPLAIELGSSSPITDRGFGAFNDYYSPTPTQCADQPTYYGQRYDDKHAHHSYLHIFSELGLLGVSLLIMFFASQFSLLKKRAQIPWIQTGLIIAFWCIIFAGFIEHRLTTPAMLLPYSLIFMLYIGVTTKQNIVSTR